MLNKTNSTISKYTSTDKSGNYTLTINNELKALQIEFRLISFHKQTFTLENVKTRNKTTILDVTLKSRTTALDEVLIKSPKNKAITVKKDTVFFEINRFKDGTELVVEDIIKKLPGMEVGNNGKIFFKGKPVENILLDGDDLFGSNYTMGTKNIDIDMIDKLSAIENYIENPLLHGLENSKAVAINLILKKGKTDFSNTTSIGLGIENKQDLKSSLLGVSKTLKSFSTISYNNVGKENSAYDYFGSNATSLESIKEQTLSLPKIIEDRILNTEIGEERSRVNHNFFTNINGIYKITKNLGMRINLDYKSDKLLRNLENRTLFTDALNNDSILQSNAIKKTPNIKVLKVKLNYKLSANKILEYNSKLKKSNIKTIEKTERNGLNQNSRSSFKENLWSQQLAYTNRINSKSAFIGKIVVNSSSLPQQLIISPEYRFSNTPEEGQQTVNLNKDYYKLTTEYLTAKNNLTSKFYLGYSLEDLKLNSLLANTNKTLPVSNNDFNYKTKHLWIGSSLFFKKKKWRYQVKATFNYLKQRIHFYSISEKDDLNRFFVTPSINVSYHISKKSNLNVGMYYTESKLNEKDLFRQPIFTSNENAISNNVNLKMIKKYKVKLGYNHNDFYNLFQLNTSLNFIRQKNNLVSNVSFVNTFFESLRTLESVNYDTTFLNLNLDTYLNGINSNLKFTGSYGVSTFKNIVNNSQVRNNIGYSGFYKVSLKTGFLNRVNFENSLEIMTSKFKTNTMQPINSISYHNVFKIYIKPTQRIRLVSSIDVYSPNKKMNNLYYFIDNSLFYTSKNNKIKYTITAKNLTTKPNSYSRTVVSDFAVSTISHNILKPYILFTVDFRL